MTIYNQTGQMLQYAPLESDRFGLRVYRGVVEDISEQQILSEVIREEVDLAILRLPSEKQFRISRLERTGLPHLVADTLVYYSVDFNRYNPKELRNSDLDFVQCSPEHYKIINNLVHEIFPNYTNHYHSNPFLDKECILEGYREWACSYIGAVEQGRISWLVQRNNQYIGFATCSFNSQTSEAEGVLYGVMPEASGGGVYGDIIRFTQKYFQQKGFAQMKVSTQIQNFAVQKVWNREGFTLTKSYCTLHINSMMHCSKTEKQALDLKITAEDVNKYGEVSCDYNPIHFDDGYAAQCGLSGRIAHGLVANSVLSKYYGMVFPGHGTLFLSYSYKFLRPLYLDREYKVSVSFPSIDADKGIFKSLVKVTDKKANELCLFAYNDLLKKGLQP